MPGCLPNIAAGRLANLFNFQGPSFITDAACASSLAAVQTARNALILKQMDIAVSGGTDSIMTPQTYVEFSKIGALTPDGSRPFSEGANGFLMGEGSGVVILKRLDDAVRDGDRIYGVVKGVGASSDGKAKGITAPNPVGQGLAIKAAYEDARIDPSTISFIEAHGTSTAVGDVAELNSLIDTFGGLPKNSIGLTSIKSQIGHLKSAAGAAGMNKALLAIKNRIIPPQINFTGPNPYFEWEKVPFYVVTEAKEWNRIAPDVPRRCAVSAFGFGGTNFHMILEEFDRDIYDAMKAAREAAPAKTPPDIIDQEAIKGHMKKSGETEGEPFLFSSDNPLELLARADEAVIRAKEMVQNGGRLRDAVEMPSRQGRYRLGISAKDPDHFEKQVELLKKVGMNEKALMALAAKGIFVGDSKRIDHGKVCLMFPGQGSQYINMFRELKDKFKIVSDTFDEADEFMKDMIPNPLSSYVFKDMSPGTPEYKEASETLRQTEYNQPSMLTADTAMYKLLKRLGIEPDIAMGHSLGEYGALIASGVMDFGDALKAVSARGREMRDLKVDDPGKMASVMAGLDKVEEVLEKIDGYVIPANKNCYVQTVIAGETKAVDRALELFSEEGIDAGQIPVSHAFHSAVVSPVKTILREYLSKLRIAPPQIPVLSNVTGDYYPDQGTEEEIKERILDLLKEQVASSVEWIEQVKRAHLDGCRTFIEVGPKRALSSFAYNLMEEDVKKGKVFPITSNHPKKGGMTTFNEMVASLWSIGFDLELPEKDDEQFYNPGFIHAFDGFMKEVKEPAPSHEPVNVKGPEETRPRVDNYEQFLDSNREAIDRFLKDVYDTAPAEVREEERSDIDLSGIGETPPTRKGVNVVVSGAAFGLPGRFKKVFAEDNLDLLIEGRNLIESIPDDYLERFIEKNIVRVDKKPDGSADIIKLDDGTKVAHLAGMLGDLDLHREFGVPENLVEVLDITTKLAFASALLALKDAGIPLVKRYSQTSTGSFLPGDWELPLELQEDTGVLFASAFPGTNNLLKELAKFYEYKYNMSRNEERGKLLEALRNKVRGTELEGELEELVGDEKEIEYTFPRNFMFRVLAMGHSQFAQYINAKGPNTQVNSACASTTLSISIAHDWVQTGRCKRVIVLGADDPSSDNMLEWFGSTLLSMGALTPEEDVAQAALPFDRRRKGMIIGAGAAALIIEAEEEPKRRGMNPLVEILGSHLGNSAFHGSRLDLAHIARSMERFIYRLEREHGFDRKEIASDMLFMSHETYTPARGGSSAAEVESLRRTFGEHFRDIMILNTKGYTGHAFGCCIEDPVLIKCLEKGVAIPIANITPDQIDPQFEGIQLSRGGKHNRHYGLRLAAGFGSQLSFLLVRKPDLETRYFDKVRYEMWLGSIATTEPVKLETHLNNLRLKDNGRENLIPSRAVLRESSEIGFEKNLEIDVDDKIFNEVKDLVVSIFAEKMGFPEDIVDIEANLETDLGIDTVKQVELFGAARIHFDLPKDEGVNLKDYPTLRHVILYVIERSGRTRKTLREDREKVAPVEKEMDGWEAARSKVIEIVAEKTGYPEDMLEIDLDLEADLGIDTVKQVELFAAAREDFDLPKDDSINLADFNSLRKIIDYVVDLKGGEPPHITGMEEEIVVEKKPSTEGKWDMIKDKVIEIVAEKTGYPEDMLELDLDLEADLGIDTVKQVELFAKAREDFDLPKDDSINLAEFTSLRKIVDYVADLTVGAEKEPEVEEQEEPLDEGPPQEQEEVPEESVSGSEEGHWDIIKGKVIEIVAEKTGYPEDMLELDLDLEADLGIDTVKQVELFAKAREDFDLPKDDSINLAEFTSLRKIVDYVADLTVGKTAPEKAGTPPPERLTVDELKERINRWVLEARKLEALEVQGDLDGMKVVVLGGGKKGAKAVQEILNAEVVMAGPEDILEGKVELSGVKGVIDLYPFELEDKAYPDDWEMLGRKTVKSLFKLTKDLDASFKDGGIFASIVRMGGRFGLDSRPNPFHGAVDGYTKAVIREYGKLKGLVLDVPPDMSIEDALGHMAKELAADHGMPEIGWDGTTRYRPVLRIIQPPS
ncbi:MAG: beta-ketoacyl synthase N-terminal-like domain-containing protein, partial [Candidatus Thermoplasmatota archaeon]|nr:beta-ketoacyl synthase N-terminal-like domain-containing protein [Candidatus Thermoplasmatota archaeon]